MPLLRLAVPCLLVCGALAAGCADPGDTRRRTMDGGTGGGTDAPAVSECDPPCPSGYACIGGICLVSDDVDMDGVPSDVDCDDASASVGRMAERPCSSSCAAGVERCTDGVWAACTAPTSCDCTPGTAPRAVPCMHCGTQMQVCDDGVWRDEGTCVGGGPCSMGTVEMGGTCGRCGVQARTCGVDCTWGAWACSEEGECTMGTTETRTSPCGSCGEGSLPESRTCSGSCSWGSWSATGSCSTSATCSPSSPPETETRACPGGCANQTRTRTCSASSCTWGAFGAWSTCPSCGPVCGNGTCESGESCSSCASDCGYGHRGSGTGGTSCAGVPAETWRCVNNTSPCGGTVSQVCRGGVWVNYNCNPRGCNACCGSYSINCDQ